MKQFVVLIVLFLTLVSSAQKSEFKHVNFKKADSIAKSYQGSSLRNLGLLSHLLTNNLNTQVEQFRAIHTWVCLNIESDHSFGETTIRKRKKFKNDSVSFSQWNTKVLSKVFKTLLKDKKTICTGYAFLIKELATLADIECEIVNGYSRNLTRNLGRIDIPNHSWNAVKLNKKWYVIDATMSSGYFNISNNTFVKDYNDGYFLASPELFITKNYPLDVKWKLTESIATLSQFVNAPMVYGNTFKHGVVPITPETLKTQVKIDDTVVFKLKIIDAYKVENTRFVISNGFSSKTINANQFKYINDILEYQYQFVKKGNYDIHVMINLDTVASYTVKVEK